MNMPTIKVDVNAHEILKEIRKMLRDKGINATFSDAIRWMYEASKDHKNTGKQ